MAIPGQVVEEGGGKFPEASELLRRFSKAIMCFNAELSGCKTGALVQVWQPDTTSEGTTHLYTQGLPFSISGVGDLLALYRCSSCGYRFSTNPSNPTANGAVGRAYVNCQVEICSDVQCHDKSVFVRADEAQRCNIHSTTILPVFLQHNLTRPIAVIEISHHEKNVHFATIIKRMDGCLKDAGLSTMNVGDIESLMGDGVGIRYQIFGPGRALATAGLSITRLGASPVVDCKERIMSERGAEAETPPMLMHHSASPPTSSQMWSPLASVSEVNGLVSAMAIDPLDAKAANRIPSPSVNQMVQPQFQGCDSSKYVIPVQGAVMKHNSMTCGERGKRLNTEQHEGSEMSDDEDHIEASMANSGSSGDSGGTDGSDSGFKKHDNRLGGGAGKRLTYKDLQAQFAVGLKEAATRLGICPTTLKRACRRNGISRWPSRQIAKLNKAWIQMGNKGNPPSWLVKNAIAGNLKADNLVFALNTGLHMELARNIETPRSTSGCNSSEFRPPSQSMALFQSADTCPVSASLLGSDDNHMLTMPSSASELNLKTMDEGFLPDMGAACEIATSGNHTWHAGQSAAELLPITDFRQEHLHENTAPQTLLVSSVSHPVNLDFIQITNDFDCPSNQTLECTQRGQDIMPMLAGFDGLADLSNMLGNTGNEQGDVNGGTTGTLGE